MKHYEVIIIGFGKGGKTLAAKLAMLGKKVALIEEDENMYGGTCINVGCIPSKSLVKNSLCADKNANWEIKQNFYYNAILEEKQLSAMLRQKNYDKLNALENITLYLGKASFINEKTLLIQGEKEVQISADRIYINTGSIPIIPDIKGLDQSKNVLTSKELMAQENLPKHLVIIGGGYIALEFACIYANFGSKVTLLQRNDTFLGKEDKDFADLIFQNLENKQIDIRLGVQFKEIKDFDQKSIVFFTQDHQDFEIECDMILLATGRKANTLGLSCDKAGIQLDKRGFIIVDDTLKTNKDSFYALGDVNGGLQFTYVSLDDYRIAYAPFRQQNYTKSKRKVIPYSVFIDPPFSRVGLNEKESIDAGYRIKVVKLPVVAIPKAQVLKKTYGLLKAIINEENDEILGAMLFCEESHEMINIVKLAMDTNLKYQVLRDQIYTHPTMSESFNDLFDI
ncbi:TPA: FAD-dependent oxidoreductase [Campylobacter jejuni]|nr:FAD-dependent oxidoreductase [Campylobacter jejuni]